MCRTITEYACRGALSDSTSDLPRGVSELLEADSDPALHGFGAPLQRIREQNRRTSARLLVCSPRFTPRATNIDTAEKTIVATKCTTSLGSSLSTFCELSWQTRSFCGTYSVKQP
jgi:hypothetical protein